MKGIRSGITKKRIEKNAVVVETIGGGTFRTEYAIRTNVHLTLVILITASCDTDADVRVVMRGEESRATIIGLVRGTGGACIRLRTQQHHASPSAASNLLVRSVLADASVMDYEGSIRVDRAAQKTDAYQRNENLLIGDTARAVSSPILEIRANDVRCTHGATVSTLNAEELWYMASRGIGRETAGKMIVRGFLSSACALIEDMHERERVEKQIAES